MANNLNAFEVFAVFLRFMSILTSILLLACIIFYPVPTLAQFGGGEDMPQRIFEAIHIGWNLGNTFDATGDETSWGNPVTTKELIQEIAKHGFKSIRIPITWRHRMGDAPDYKIDEVFLQRIHEVVDWALETGFYVIINMHHDSSWVFNMKTDYDEVLKRFKAAWKQISASFKDYPPDRLMFESINEPRFSDDWNEDKPEYFEMLRVLNTTFYQIVRGSGGNNTTRYLLLPTLTCSASPNRLKELYNTIVELNDKNLIATVHYYGYWPFSVNIAGVTTFDETTKNDIINTFNRIYDTFVANGIPVIIGEFGLLGFDTSLDTIQQGEKIKYFEFITYYAKEKKLPLMWWDNGQHFDRVNFKWSDPQLYEVIINSVKARSSTGQTDSIYIKKNSPIEDVEVRLNLNGNELVEVKYGEDTLVKGKDYDLSDDKLIIKADFLRQVISGEFGVKAVLSCRFSAGAEWKLNVIYYDTPILRDMIEERVDNFFIPVTYNGAQLKALEAVYKKNGRNTPPNDWTSFKQYYVDFKPSTYRIELSSDFLRGLEDGEILLKVHFWSGEKIEYTLVKNGNKVRGISSQEMPDSPQNDQPVDDTGDNGDEGMDTPNQEQGTKQPSEPSSSHTKGITGYMIAGTIIIVAVALIGAYAFGRVGHKHQTKQ